MGERRSCSRVSLLVMSTPTVFALACGGDRVTVDASPDSPSPTDGGVVIALPEIPWLVGGAPDPGLRPCPTGWRDAGDAECDPYPEGGADVCGDGEAHFPGEMGCRRVGDACPAGAFATDLVEPVVYVDSTAAPGGDGSMASPHDALANVPWASLTAGTTVALAKGTFDGVLSLRAGVSVVGACAAETAVTGVAAPIPAVVSVTSGGDVATVANLTIRAPPQRGAQVSGGRALALRGVVIEGAEDLGIAASDVDTTLALDDVVVRDTRALAASPTSGRGLSVRLGAELDARRVIFESNVFMGVFISDEGTRATFSDAVIRGTEASADGVSGRGINVQSQGRLEAARLLLDANHEVGLYLSDAGTTASTSDTIIRGTRSRVADGQLGRGVDVGAGATLSATRLLVHDNRLSGILAAGDGSRVVIDGGVIRDNLGQETDDRGGRGIGVQDGAALELRGVILRRNREAGLFASGAPVVLSDVAIVQTLSQDRDAVRGRGLNVQMGGSLDASRVLIDESREIGLYLAGGGTTAALADVVITRVLGQQSDGAPARGINVQEEARLDGARVRIEDARAMGVVSLGDSIVVLDDLHVADVDRADCADTTCSDAPYGYGASAEGATLRLTRFQLERAATCGVFLSSYATREAPVVDLMMGSIAESEIGACVQYDGYALSRLTTDVEYRDNGVNLDTTSLPVPEASDPLSE